MSAEASVQEGERPVGLDELFFSTTDAGGRIVAGNPVFARVSGLGFRITIGRLQAELAVFVALEMLGARAGGPRRAGDGGVHRRPRAGRRGRTRRADGRRPRPERRALGDQGRHHVAEEPRRPPRRLQMNGRVEAAHLAEAGNIVHLLGEFQERVDVVRGQTEDLDAAVETARLRAAQTAESRELSRPRTVLPGGGVSGGLPSADAELANEPVGDILTEPAPAG